MIVRPAAVWAFLSFGILGTAAGCSSSNAAVHRGDFASNVCARGALGTGVYDPTRGLTLARNGMYLEVTFVSGALDDKSTSRAVAMVGASCAAAPDPAQCANDLKAARESGITSPLPEICGGAGCRSQGGYIVVAEQAGVVERITSAARLRSVLGAIDTPEKAAFLAGFYYTSNLQITCGSNQVRAVTGGFEVLIEVAPGPCAGLQQTVVRVSSDGTMVETYSYSEEGKQCA